MPWESGSELRKVPLAKDGWYNQTSYLRIRPTILTKLIKIFEAARSSRHLEPDVEMLASNLERLRDDSKIISVTAKAKHHRNKNLENYS